MTAAVELREWLEERATPERALLARLWNLPGELSAQPAEMAAAMLAPERVRAALERLNARERAALERIQSHGGSLPAPVVEREFGAPRAAEGYANPRAYLLALSAPPTPTERLYLLGFVQVVGPAASRRYAIPPDLLPMLPDVQPPTSAALAPVAAPEQVLSQPQATLEAQMLALLQAANTSGLVVAPGGLLKKADAQRLLRQNPLEMPGPPRSTPAERVQFLAALAESAGLLRNAADGMLRVSRAALEWMQLPALERARHLLEGWYASAFDELAVFGGLRFTRAYGRDVTRARRALLRLLGQHPAGEWFAVDALIADVQANAPDFARPQGYYDTWGIQNSARQSLDGFRHWDAVEGAQIRMVLGGPLFWLGLAELGIEDGALASFRLTPLAASLLQGAPPEPEFPVTPLVVQPNFEVVVPPLASLHSRFQLSRVAELVRDSEVAVYRLSRAALLAALERGTTLEDVVRFLAEASGRELPQNVAATLAEWAGQHGQVQLRRAVLLETANPALLQQLLHDRRLRFPQGETLGETTVALGEGDAAQLAERLRKAGYGLAGDVAPATPFSESDLTTLVAALEFYAAACAELGIAGEPGNALRRRAARLLPETQLHRALQASNAALDMLRERLES